MIYAQHPIPNMEIYPYGIHPTPPHAGRALANRARGGASAWGQSLVGVFLYRT